jgi:uncharacterized membrane protein YhaH (DUF805 family)
MGSLLFSFQGRVNRAKWWLVNIVATAVYLVVSGLLVGGAMSSSDPSAALQSMGTFAGIVMFVVSIAILWVSLAVAAKRWHDRGKTAWWILIAFVPVIGSIWYLIECGFLKGTTGANKYGADPLAAA